MFGKMNIQIPGAVVTLQDERVTWNTYLAFYVWLALRTVATVTATLLCQDGAFRPGNVPVVPSWCAVLVWDQRLCQIANHLYLAVCPIHLFNCLYFIFSWKSKSFGWQNIRQQEGFLVGCVPPACANRTCFNSQQMSLAGRIPRLMVTQGPPLNRLTDTSENISFPQLRWRAVINRNVFMNFVDGNMITYPVNFFYIFFLGFCQLGVVIHFLFIHFGRALFKFGYVTLSYFFDLVAMVFLHLLFLVLVITLQIFQRSFMTQF